MQNTLVLIELVKANNLEQFKDAIQNEIKLQGTPISSWHLDKDFLEVVRAILESKKVEFMQVLLENGFNAAQSALIVENSSETLAPLSLATQNDDIAMIKLLSDYRYLANHERRLSLGHSLNIAVETRNYHLVAFLLQQGADLNYQTHSRALTPLARAIQIGDSDIVRLFIEHKANIVAALFQLREEWDNAHNDQEGKINNSNNKQALQTKTLKELEYTYLKDLQVLLDECVGEDFENLDFLKDIDISGLNFVGISVNGAPVTKEYLIACQFKGAENSLVTLSEIDQLQDGMRQSKLLESIETIQASLGLSEEIDRLRPVNFISLGTAVKFNDINTVKNRLACKVNPNTIFVENSGIKKLPLILAVEKNHSEIAIALANDPDIHKPTLIQAIRLASRKKFHGLYQELKEIFTKSAVLINDKKPSYIKSISVNLDGSIIVDVDLINGLKPEGCSPTNNPQAIYEFCNENRFALGPQLLEKLKGYFPLVFENNKEITIPSENELIDALCRSLYKNHNEAFKLLSCLPEFNSPEMSFNRYQNRNPLFIALHLYYINNTKLPGNSQNTLENIINLLRQKNIKLPANFWTKPPDFNTSALNEEQSIFECFMSLKGILENKPQASEKFKQSLRKTILFSKEPPSFFTRPIPIEEIKNVSLPENTFSALKDYFKNVSELFSDIDQCLKLLTPVENSLKSSSLNLSLNPPTGYISDAFVSLPLCNDDYEPIKKYNLLRNILINLVKNIPDHPEINIFPLGDFVNVFGFASPELVNRLMSQGTPFWEKRYAQWVNIHSSSAHPLQITLLALAHLSDICPFPAGMTLKDILHYLVSEDILINESSPWNELLDKAMTRNFSSPSFINSTLMGPMGEKYCPTLCSYLRDSFWKTYQKMSNKVNMSLEEQLILDLAASGAFSLHEKFTLTNLKEHYKEKNIEMELVDNNYPNVFFKKKVSAPEKPSEDPGNKDTPQALL